MSIIFDIETASLPEETLRTLYREPTYEEFAESCDQRWKDETKREKYESGKSTAWLKFVDRAALSASTGRVVAIGLLNTAKNDHPRIVDANPDEPAALAKFWKVYCDCRRSNINMIGCYSNAFDLPFLIRRSWINRVDVPASVRVNNRYFDSLFLDVSEIWTLGQRGGGGGDSASLDAMARALGVGSKADAGEGVDGKSFARLWCSGVAEERELAAKYLRNDLAMTAGVASRMGIT